MASDNRDRLKYYRDYYLKNKERIIKRIVDKQKNDRDLVNERHRTWSITPSGVESRKRSYETYRDSGKRKIAQRIRYEINKDAIRQYQRKYNQELSILVLSHYSGSPPKCKCCGESNIKFLTIDHIDGNGRQDRLRLGLRGGGYIFYAKLRKLGYPIGYQVLCWNCNCGRAKNGGICPHKEIILSEVAA